MEIIHVNIVEDGKILEDSFLRTRNGKIETIGSMEHYQKEAEMVIDGEENYLCPGFIDIHNHGARGFDAMDASVEALSEISQFHIENGVTSFLLTTMTGPLWQVTRLCEAIKQNGETKRIF